MRTLSYKTQKKLVIVLFMFIPLVLLLTFWYYLAFRLFQQSFTDWDGLSRNLHYIGLQNYIEVLKSQDTYTVFSANLSYLLTGFLQIIIGLYFAVILNGRLRGTYFYRSAIFMPYILNIAAVAYLFNYLYDYQNSPVNIILTALGLGEHAIHFLSESYWSNLSLGLVGTWIYTGLVMVLFLGAMQSISHEIYEGAEIDGANFMHKFRYITLPSIKTTMELVILLVINGALQGFIQTLLMTQGGPGIRTETFVSYTLKIAFLFQKFGKASALGVILTILIFILVSLVRKALNGKGE